MYQFDTIPVFPSIHVYHCIYRYSNSLVLYQPCPASTAGNISRKFSMTSALVGAPATNTRLRLERSYSCTAGSLVNIRKAGGGRNR